MGKEAEEDVEEPLQPLSPISPKYKIYKYRWVCVCMFALIQFINGSIYCFLSPITNIIRSVNFLYIYIHIYIYIFIVIRCETDYCNTQYIIDKSVIYTCELWSSQLHYREIGDILGCTYRLCIPRDYSMAKMSY